LRGWALVALVAVQTYALRWIGTSSAGWLGRAPAGERLVRYVAPAVLGGLVALATFTSDGALVLDARAAGVTVAAVAALLRAPIIVVVGLAVLVTAVVRSIA
jgi:hypothetical protein